MFENLKTSDDVAEATDKLSGGSFVVDTDVHEMDIDMAYIDYSDGGAMSLVLTLTAPGKTLRQTLWMTSGDAKGNKNFYLDRNNNKEYLPGFTLADDLSLMTCNIPMAQQVAEEKTINVFDFVAKKELPTKKMVVTAMLKKKIRVAVFKQIVDKSVKNENFNADLPVHPDTNPKYVTTGETREENEIDKFFSHAKSLTVVEAKAGVEEGVFIHQWTEKNAGVVRNRAKGATATAGATGAVNATAAAPAAEEAKTNLFG